MAALVHAGRLLMVAATKLRLPKQDVGPTTPPLVPVKPVKLVTAQRVGSTLSARLTDMTLKRGWFWVLLITGIGYMFSYRRVAQVFSSARHRTAQNGGAMRCARPSSDHLAWLVVRPRRFAEGSAHPVVLAAGIKPGEELRARALPVFASTVGRSRCDRVSRVCVLARNQRERSVGSSASEHRMGSLLIRSDVSLVYVDGVADALDALQHREQAR